MTTISLEGVHFHGDHGYHDEEQLIGNDFILDISVYADTSEAADKDDLSKTVNYETIYRLIEIEMRETAELLETLARRITDRIEDFFDNVKGVRIKLRKLNPPMGGRIAAASVEIRTGLFGLPLLSSLKALQDLADDLEDSGLE